MSHPKIDILRLLFPNFSYPFQSRFLQDFQQESPKTTSKQKRVKKSKSKFMKLDISKIRTGNDNRTTLMIKNLPQFLSYENLSETLGISEYIDYIYIPTMNDCPEKILGFAFVNVIKPSYIIDVIDTIQKKESVLLNKSLEICYSKIQGKDALEKSFGEFKKRRVE